MFSNLVGLGRHTRVMVMTHGNPPTPLGSPGVWTLLHHCGIREIDTSPVPPPGLHRRHHRRGEGGYNLVALTPFSSSILELLCASSELVRMAVLPKGASEEPRGGSGISHRGVSDKPHLGHIPVLFTTLSSFPSSILDLL